MAFILAIVMAASGLVPPVAGFNPLQILCTDGVPPACG
jgi:hypothetical protein